MTLNDVHFNNPRTSLVTAALIPPTVFCNKSQEANLEKTGGHRLDGRKIWDVKLIANTPFMFAKVVCSEVVGRWRASCEQDAGLENTSRGHGSLDPE